MTRYVITAAEGTESERYYTGKTYSQAGEKFAIFGPRESSKAYISQLGAEQGVRALTQHCANVEALYIEGIEV